jgi:hypothetical protein
MNTKIFRILIQIAFTIAIISCSKEDFKDFFKNEKNSSSTNYIQKDGMIVLGNRINDPYEITNIRQAYSNLKAADSDVLDENIEPNKLYLRFLPKNEEEWQVLKKDSNLVLFDFPLDYEIEIYGTYYHDPNLPDSSITWQYCVVPKEYKIPDIQHEIIYEVFIPSLDSVNIDTSFKNATDINDLYEQIVCESFKLTGNIKESESNLKSAQGLFSPKRWNPSGNITVYDNVLNRPIPLEGAEVHARWSTHIETDITDSMGNFSMGGFIYDVNYAIKWERGYYDIRNGGLLQAWYNGPKQDNEWNLYITGGESIMYATIHRAAFNHFYGDNLGIRRPILSDGDKTKIIYKDGEGTGVFWGDWSSTGILPDIKIWGKNSGGNYKPTNQIFGTTAHELGHQAHSQYMGNVQYWQVSKTVYESWADAVEWALSNDEYHKLGNEYGIRAGIIYNHIYNNHSSWPFVDDKAYSPIFIDLMDNINQRTAFGTGFPNDLISGYTLSYINFNILKNSYGLSSLRDEVKKHKITGVTDAQVDQLFALYW